jgi:hypothetical protein
MAFKNEYIPEADYEKYDLLKICGEHNEINRGHMYSRDWTIDRERNAFLIQVWSHRDAEFDGFAFYWKGEWISLEMRITGVGNNPVDSSDWTGYLVKGFVVPVSLTAMQQEVVDAFKQALAAYRGAGIHSSRKSSTATATVDFIGE